MKALCVTDSLQAAELMTEVRGDLERSIWSARLDLWLSQLLSSESSSPKAYASLLRACNTALNMAKDTGYEAAMLYLASACTDAGAASQQTASNALGVVAQQTASKESGSTGIPKPSLSNLLETLSARVLQLIKCGGLFGR